MARDEELKRADTAARDRLAAFPRVVGVRHSEELDRLLIDLASGIGLVVDYRDIEGLENARSDDLNLAEISPSGFGLHFPSLDADVYVPALIEGRLGSAAYMAARLGSAGGRARTAEKARAARKNGRLGGRPRKQASA